ncbi:hypothetical protein K458DRAFT_395846 [Lentithecium fluviatile CBS 122367]|uniref:F-box domain-containing protein n=1 Tax=Lentithecium fluviatile CBS 122367 TaxID=1168545 RepID=A0A6G1IHZ9_9PLEO|nr:hypothetical protein K458DRAFT_395846 [Lentithecium fluviatile CBS 122367]
MAALAIANNSALSANTTPPMVAAQPHQPFRFLDLPTELRLQVYENLLVVGKVFFTPHWVDMREGSRYKDFTKYAKPEVAILRVNNQIHDEAEPVYLEKNLFVLPLHWHKRHPFHEFASASGDDRGVCSAAAKPSMKNISIAFDPTACDLAHTQTGSDWNSDEGKFDDLSSAERLRVAHDRAKYRLLFDWDYLRERAIFNLQSQMEYLELDFTNAYCPVGCCRIFNQRCHLSLFYGLSPKKVTVLELKNENEEKRFLSGFEFYDDEDEDVEVVKKFGINFGGGEDLWVRWQVEGEDRNDDGNDESASEEKENNEERDEV